MFLIPDISCSHLRILIFASSETKQKIILMNGIYLYLQWLTFTSKTILHMKDESTNNNSNFRSNLFVKIYQGWLLMLCFLCHCFRKSYTL